MSTDPSLTALVMLTDGRFPSGGHAYSAGMEQAVNWGDVDDLDTAEAFAAGRARSSTVVAAQVVAAARVIMTDRSDGSVGPVRLLDLLDAEVDARMASSAAREVSRQQGRRWLRTVRGVWPEPFARPPAATGSTPELLAARHGWVVTGATAGVLGLHATDAAAIALYDLVGTPLWAAVRLMGLDPVATAGAVARLVAAFQPAATRATREATDRVAGDLAEPGRRIDWSWISWSTAPMSDLAAEAHLGREERLFAS